jgi:hemerythrin
LTSAKFTPDLADCQMTSDFLGRIVRIVQKTSDIIWQDAQHQVLFQLLDEVEQDNCATDVLSQLKFYAESHFSLEEHYMQLLAYPGRQEHVQAHDKFRLELVQMMEGESGVPDTASRQLIATFLREWLKRHIFGIDKPLEAFLLAADVK